MKYYRRNEDGTISTANELHGPGWSLDGTNPNEGRDGWLPFATDEAAYSWFAENPEPKSAIAAVKAEAHRRITAQFPVWRQNNIHAACTELLDKWRLGGSLTAEDEAVADYGRTVFAWIKSVRAHSDVLEARIVAGETVDPATDPDWPIWSL